MSTAWHAFPMLDRLFDDVMTGMAGTSLGPSTPARGFSPAIDVRANNDEIVFTADVPGVKRDDTEVTLDAGVLSIKGQRRYVADPPEAGGAPRSGIANGAGKDKVWLGRSFGSFERSFTLPDTVDPDHLSADLADGVLTVRVARLPKAKPRKITIGAAPAAQLPDTAPKA